MADYNMAAPPTGTAIACPNCGALNPMLQQLKKKSNPLMALLYIILLLIPVVGWIVLFIHMITREKTFTSATCQKCGHSWEVPKQKKR